MYRNFSKYCASLVVLLALPAFTQNKDEIVEPVGMKEIMADIVVGKYRSKQASAAPWSSDTVATSAHLQAVVENEICNSYDFDVKFVSKNTNAQPRWRDPIPFEQVEYKGKLRILSNDKSSEMLMESTSSGIVLRKTVSYWRGKEIDWVWLGTGMVIKGMSGGPVIATSDGSVVGIIMGRPAKGLEKYEFERNKYGDLTIFVPYSIVDYVWRNCNKED